MFFWFFLFIFIIFTPIILYRSLGYKFDIKSKKIKKVGAISIKTFPQETNVFLDGVKISSSTPYILEGLLPKQYTITLEKENFYPYVISVEVKPSFVSDVDVTLVPKMRRIEKLKSDLNIYKFFVLEHLLGKKFIAFTDKGIYFLDENFENAQKLAPLPMEKTIINSILGLKEGKNQLVFWNQHNIWLVSTSRLPEKKDSALTFAYQGKEPIKEVFFALKQKYLIIHEGMNIIAIDAKNPAQIFSIFQLESINSEIFYDSDSDVLYIKDKIPSLERFSLFRVDLMELIHEKRTD